MCVYLRIMCACMVDHYLLYASVYGCCLCAPSACVCSVVSVFNDDDVMAQREKVHVCSVQIGVYLMMMCIQMVI